MELNIPNDIKVRHILLEAYEQNPDYFFKRGGWRIKDRDEMIAYCESHGFTVIVE